VDPAIARARDERKRKKLWKEIRRLQRLQKQLKPLDECEIPYALIDEKMKRIRPPVKLSLEILDYRAHLLKEWSQYRGAQKIVDYQIYDRIMYSQQKALDCLKKESEFLYEEAIKIDQTFLPFSCKGPTETPPIKDYDSPDGEYKDVSRNWDKPVFVIDEKTKKNHRIRNAESQGNRYKVM